MRFTSSQRELHPRNEWRQEDTCSARLSTRPPGTLRSNFGINLTIGLIGRLPTHRRAFIAGTSTDGAFGGAEGTYQLTKNLIVFANYTGIEQSSTTPLPTNALNQLMNTIGFGIGFSPRQAHPRQQ